MQLEHLMREVCYLIKANVHVISLPEQYRGRYDHRKRSHSRSGLHPTEAQRHSELFWSKCVIPFMVDMISVPRERYGRTVVGGA